MKVLHFAFGKDLPESGYAPHNHVPNAVVYTGTHDNNTTLGWYQQGLKAADRKRLVRLPSAQRDGPQRSFGTHAPGLSRRSVTWRWYRCRIS